MAVEPLYPVIVLEVGDGTVYECSSYETLVGRIEPIDIENGEYAAWDASQRSLKLSVVKGKQEWLQIEVTDEYADSREFEIFRSRAKPVRVRTGLFDKVKRIFQR